MNNNKQYSALEIIVIVAVVIYFVIKALIEITTQLSKVVYNLGVYYGKIYFSSNASSKTAVSETVSAITTEVKEVKVCAGNYLMGCCLVTSYLHSVYLDLPSIWEIKLHVKYAVLYVKYAVRKFMTSDKVVALYK